MVSKVVGTFDLRLTEPNLNIIWYGGLNLFIFVTIYLRILSGKSLSFEPSV